MGTIIKWNSSSTDDVCNGNRRPINSRHTEVCHLQLNMCMFCATRDGYIALPTTVPAVLADSLLHCFFLRVNYDHKHIQQYVFMSVQSCNASKQLLQGEKQQKFYMQRNFLAFCSFNSLIFSAFYIFLGKLFYLTLSSSLIIF